MSRAEKRYFKLHTSRHLVAGHSNHQALFDAIAAMPAYDDILSNDEIAAVLDYIKSTWPEDIRRYQWERTLQEPP